MPQNLLPRHTRGYLWIGFLVAIFMLMALSENGIFSTDSVLPNPVLIAKGNGNQKYLDEASESDFSSPTPKVVYESSSSSAPTPISTSLSDSLEIPLSKPSLKPIPSSKKPKEKQEELTFNGLSPTDVVILVKTGATSLWRRLPAHLSTTLSNPLLTPNIIYYSDSPDNINGHPIIDVLANSSSTLKLSPDFALYSAALEVNENNLYLESGSMEGDFYLPGGWRLDKYKFLPMFQHAAREFQGQEAGRRGGGGTKKWFVYMEDDNYFFWEDLFSFLGTLDHTSPLLIGSPAFRLGEDFAHGGSGFAVSGKAVEVSFGRDEGLVGKWEGYAREQCCGDQVLSHVFKEMGVERYKGLDGGAWAGLQSLPHWRIGFGSWNWCSALLNVHKVHQRDVSRLFVFEKEFRERVGMGTGMRYRDLFGGMAKEGMLKVEERSEWDNYAQAKTFASSYDEDVKGKGGKKLSQKEIEAKPWFSKESCKRACEEWDQCLSWKYADDNCAIDHTAAMGQKIDAGIRMESGWMIERIKKLEGMECEPLGF